MFEPLNEMSHTSRVMNHVDTPQIFKPAGDIHFANHFASVTTVVPQTATIPSLHRTKPFSYVSLRLLTNECRKDGLCDIHDIVKQARACTI